MELVCVGAALEPVTLTMPTSEGVADSDDVAAGLAATLVDEDEETATVGLLGFALASPAFALAMAAAH